VTATPKTPARFDPDEATDAMRQAESWSID